MVAGLDPDLDVLGEVADPAARLNAALAALRTSASQTPLPPVTPQPGPQPDPEPDPDEGELEEPHQPDPGPEPGTGEDPTPVPAPVEYVEEPAWLGTLINQTTTDRPTPVTTPLNVPAPALTPPPTPEPDPGPDPALDPEPGTEPKHLATAPTRKRVPLIIAAAAVMLVAVVPAVGLVTGRYRVMALTGSDMGPALSRGSLMWTEPVRYGDPEPGDVVIYDDAKDREQIRRVRETVRDRNKGLVLAVSTDQDRSDTVEVPVNRTDMWRTRRVVPLLGWPLVWLSAPWAKAGLVIAVMVTAQVVWIHRRTRR